MTARRIETIGSATLYLGDAVDIMPTLGGLDLMVTDPPYRLTSGGGSPSWATNGSFAGYDNKGSPVACDLDWSDWLPVAFACLRADADAYVMANDRQMFPAFEAATDAGFRFHRIVTWDKGSATPNRWYMPNVEFGLYLFKGKAKTIRSPGSFAGVRIPHRDQTQHRTEKPTALFDYWIRNSSDIGQTVIDPFMGTGTAGVAAARLGRPFIGIEIEDRWFDVACERIRRAQDQADLFAMSGGQNDRPRSYIPRPD